MRIHTDKLTEFEFSAAITRAGLVGVWVEEIEEHGSRKRARAFEVTLAAKYWRGRRWKNSGWGGRAALGAATFDEHGRWMAQLYEVDPDMVFGRAEYTSRDHFHEQTNDRYRVKECECVGA